MSPAGTWIVVACDDSTGLERTVSNALSAHLRGECPNAEPCSHGTQHRRGGCRR